MKLARLAFLRPRPTKKISSIPRACNATQFRCSSASTYDGTYPASAEVRERIKELDQAGFQAYPSLQPDAEAISPHTLMSKYTDLVRGGTAKDDFYTMHGRILSIRVVGSKLFFLDIRDGKYTGQVLCGRDRMSDPGVTDEDFRGFSRLLRRGDIISVTGNPYRTNSGHVTIRATQLPKLLAPTLHPLPTVLLDEQTQIQRKHEDLLVNPRSVDIMLVRSRILGYLHIQFRANAYLEVQTPIMAARAGGAAARPFETTATEFRDRQIQLRIAPELWLKRLIVGGLSRVYEIGPCFRNEGIDPTHNPEFYMCEAYCTFADLEYLIRMTEDFMNRIAQNFLRLRETILESLPPLAVSFEPPYKQLEFVPTLEASLGQPLPDLSAEDAGIKLLKIFEDMKLQVPTSPTLPRLLDRLSSLYIEPQCQQPTFLLHHPECMSPLAKSSLDPVTNQRLSARMELFVQGQEIANAYEEENSPFEQRRKFVEQLNYRQDGTTVVANGDESFLVSAAEGSNDEETSPLLLRPRKKALSVIDESYLEALEWGMPPTGGWGCGVDRLVMLFSGSPRIGDVLSFGTLRNVVSLH